MYLESFGDICRTAHVCIYSAKKMSKFHLGCRSWGNGPGQARPKYPSGWVLDILTDAKTNLEKIDSEKATSLQDNLIDPWSQEIPVEGLVAFSSPIWKVGFRISQDTSFLARMLQPVAYLIIFDWDMQILNWSIQSITWWKQKYPCWSIDCELQDIYQPW